MPNTKVRIKRLTSWEDVKECAMATCGTEWCPKEITSEWKKKILAAEHSPLRALHFRITFTNIESWVATHLLRHTNGVTPFVQSQREDRSKDHKSRHELPQDAPVLMKLELNAQSILNISRKRLCCLASPETRAVWQLVKDELIRMGETELAAYMIPECVHQHGCPEMKGCGRMPPLPLRSIDDDLFAKPAVADMIAEIWKD